MTNELIGKAKECKSAEELLALAKENNIEMTAEEAAETLETFNKEGELSDEEIDNVSGGACHTTVDGKEYVVVSSSLACFTGEYQTGTRVRDDHKSLRKTWGTQEHSDAGDCGKCIHLEFKGGIGYCGKSGK